MTSNTEYLDDARLGVIPNPLKLGRALMRPHEPFVMINLLSFKQQATGDYAHLTGQEAYDQYAQSVQRAQAPLGSRLLWSGQVQEKITEGNAPGFHVIALLEYASPKAFIKFLTKGGSNTKARAAGLNGQWLISSTTQEEGKLPGSDEEPIVLIELSGGMKQNPVAYKTWQIVCKSTYQVFGAKMLWYGRCNHHILGTANPTLEAVLVTWFPNPRALNQAMSDSKRNDYMQSICPYLAYTASSLKDFFLE